MAEIVCGTCGTNDGTHERWCAVGRRITEIAAKDRRIAELEAALRSLLGCRRSDIVDELHAAADVLNGTPTLDALLAQAKREALEDAADVFAVDPYRPVERALRRMAREVKP